MKFRYPAALTIILIAVTGLFAAPGYPGQVQGQGWSQQDRVVKENIFLHSHLISISVFENPSPGRKTRADKRHGKSLMSEAFLTDFSIPAPRFSYQSRKYSLFLPGVDSRQPVNRCSLRGPPFSS